MSLFSFVAAVRRAVTRHGNRLSFIAMCFFSSHAVTLCQLLYYKELLFWKVLLHENTPVHLYVINTHTTVLNDLFCPTVVDEVWREQTLLRLLNLVELPLLEGLLQCSQTPPSAPCSNMLAHSNPDLIYSSNHLDRQILKAFRDSQYVTSDWCDCIF